MKRKRLLILAIVLLSCPVSTFAYLEDYSPFPNSKPKQFPLRQLSVVEKDNEQATFGDVRNGRAIPLIKLIEVQEANNYFVLLSIFDTSGKLIKDSMKVCDSFFWREAYAGDLNRDGTDDYVIQIASGSTGLGGYKNFVVFALSTGGSYEATTVFNWDSDSVVRDFVDLRRNGRCQFIHTSFTYIDTKNGLAHSHWVYNILEIRGAKLVLANEVNPMFPKWVWYTIKPNSRASRFMTKTKALAWAKSQFGTFFWKAES